MGLFDGRSYSESERLGVPRTSSYGRSHSRGVSPARSAKSTGNGHGYYSRPNYSRSASGGSFFGTTSRGIFGNGNSSSYYKRRPRDGYISYLMQKLQRMIKELWVYARRHPVKAFFAVIVPLLSAGGAIHGLLRQFGVRMPFGLDGATGRGGGGYYGSSGYGGGRGGSSNWMDNAGGLMQIAKAFM